MASGNPHRRGDRLGRYRILDELGAGGMGRVYLADDPRLDRRVAIKLLPPELAAERERLERFEREARAVAALNHPNIVTLFSVEDELATDVPGGEPLRFLTMEWVEGETLDRVIADGGLPLARFFELALPLVDAVAAAHGAGIVHRDLKPANVMVTRDGRIKVLDFGIAKLEQPQTDAAEATTALTREGLVMGTLQYMAPEQALGRSVGPAADVFALGILSYEMLTGRRPFGGSSAAELVSAILRDEPRPLESLRPGIPSDLAGIVARSLDKSLDRRYRSANQVLEALAATHRAFERAQLLGEAASAEHAVDDSTTTFLAQPAPSHTPPRPAVAVLGFRNLLGDAAADWLSTGITETVTVDLEKLPGVRVVSREKLVRELGTGALVEVDEGQLREAGGRIGIDWIVRGAFQKLGETIRITASFVDVAAGELIDSVKLDGTMSDIFILQDRIVRELAETLELESPEPRTAAPAGADELEAYECYARGVELVARMDAASLEDGRRFLERAIELDPDYALAYSGLGYLHAMRFIATTDPADLEVSVERLERAVELDPELSQPWVWLGYDLNRLGRKKEAVAASRKAVELDPDNPLAHYIHGAGLFFHSDEGWQPELLVAAIEHLRDASRLAPRYQPAWQLEGALYFRHGQYDDARPPIERAAEIEASGNWELSRFLGAHTLLGRLGHRTGDLGGSRAAYQKSLRLVAASQHFYAPMVHAASLCGLADLDAEAGRPGEALSAYRRAREFAEAYDRALGVGWLVVRSRLGMATSFRRLGMRREEDAAFEAALELFETRREFDFSALWDDGPASLHYELARYRALRQEPQLALEALERSLQHGWGDLPWLERDELLTSLAGDPAFEACLDRLRARHALPPRASSKIGFKNGLCR